MPSEFAQAKPQNKRKRTVLDDSDDDDAMPAQVCVHLCANCRRLIPGRHFAEGRATGPCVWGGGGGGQDASEGLFVCLHGHVEPRACVRPFTSALA